MVQKVPYTVSTGLNSQYKYIDETCSCTKCDSLFCFSKRHFVDSCSCSCKNCKESKTCLFFTNRLVRVNESRSVATNAAPTLTTATGDNAHSYGKYTSFHKVESTKSNDAVFTSKPPSKTLAITLKQSSAITHKQPYASQLGQKVLASGIEMQSIYNNTQRKPFESSLNTIKKDGSGIKHSSCCSPQQSAISRPNSHSCGHHRSSEVYSEPEQMSCVSQETKPPSSPGYVLELTTCNSTKSRTDTCEVICVDYGQSKTKKSSKDNICDETASECKFGTLAPDSPGYIFDLKKPCECNESSKDESESLHDPLESSGYILDLTEGSYKQTTNALEKCKNIFTNQLNAIKALCNTCLQQSNPKARSEGAAEGKSVKITPDSLGYQNDVKNKKLCACYKSLEETQMCCKGDDSKKPKSASEHLTRGYVFDVPKSYDTCCDHKRLKLQRKNTCDCQVQIIPDDITNSAGYVYIVSSHKAKHQPEKQSSSIETIKKKYLTMADPCRNCSEPKNTLESTKQKLVLYVNGSGKTKKTMLQNQKNVYGCSDPHKTAHKLSKPIYESPVPNAYKLELCKNILEIQKNAIETLDNLCLLQKKCCNFPLNPIEPSANCTEQKYLQKPSSIKQELCANILGTQLNAVGILHDVTRAHENSCSYSCNDDTKSFNSPESSANTCVQNVSNTDIHKQKTELKKNRQKFLINYLETNRTGFKSLRSSYKKCECNNNKDNNKDSRGYVMDVEQSKEEQTINTSQKKKCECEESRKRLSSSAGYILDLDQYKHEAVNKTRKLTKNESLTKMNECQLNCDTRKRLSSSAGYIYELDQYKHEPMNRTRKLCKNVFDVQRNTIESINNTNLKKGCECSEPQKGLSDSSGYILELQQYIKPPINTSQKLSNIQEIKGDTLNNKCPKSCGCNKTSKVISESSGLELDQYNKHNKSTTESSKKKGCECSEGHKKISDSRGYIFDLETKTHKLSKNIFGIQKDGIESLTNSNQKKSCGCSDARKRLSSSAGYILELEQYKNKLPTAFKDFSKTTEEVKYNTSSVTNYRCQTSCAYRKPSEMASDPRGYILDLDQYKQEPGNNENKKCKCSQEKKLSDSASETQQISKNNSEIKTNTSCHNNCVCRKPSQITSDPPGYILELEKLDNTNKKKGCQCSEGHKKLSESRGYIFDLDKQDLTTKTHKLSKNIFGIQKDGIESLTNSNQKKSCGCSDARKRLSSSAGYILELEQYKNKLPTALKEFSKTIEEARNNPSHTCQASFESRKPSKMISDPRGYVMDLDQYKQEQPKNKNNKCKCGQEKKQLSDSASGLQHIAGQLSNTSKTFGKDIPEIKTSTTCHKSCVCRKPSQIVSNPPGYILELEKSSKSKDNFDLKTNTSCHKSCVCRKPSQIVSNPPGYILELEKTTKSKDNFELKTNTSCHKSCVCRKPSQIVSNPPGYILELEKSTKSKDNFDLKTNTSCHKSCVCRKPSQIVSNPPGYILELEKSTKSKDNFELKTNTSCHKSCVCRKPSQIVSNPPGYILELEKSNKSKDNFELKTNTTCHKSCVCRKPSQIVSNPPGYILELEKSNKSKDNFELKTNTTCHKSCVCRKPSQIVSNPPGYILELEKSNKSKDNFEIKTNTSCHKSCVCRKPSKIVSNPPGYILELEKSNNTNKKKGCECGGGHKRLSESKGYILDLDKYIQDITTKTYKSSNNKFGIQTNESLTNPNQKKGCGCSEAQKGLSSSAYGYTLEPEQHKNIIPTALKEFNNNQPDIPNSTCQTSCVCRKPSKITSDPPGYILELDQYKQEQTKHGNEKCKCSHGTNPSDHASESRHIARQLLNTPKTISDPPGYVLEQNNDESVNKTNKIGKNSFEVQNKTIESLNNTKNDKRCECSKEHNRLAESRGYIFDLDNYKQDLTNKTHKLSKNIFGIQKDAIESLTNPNQKKSCGCGCSEARQRLPSSAGYILELEHQNNKLPTALRELGKTIAEVKQNKPDMPNTCQKSCVCRKPPLTISDPPGYILDLEEYNHGTANKTHIVGKNVFEIRRNTVETLNNANMIKMCACSDSQKRLPSAGYTLELEQYHQEPFVTPLRSNKNTHERTLGNNINQKNSNACDECQKKFSSSAGYILELDQYKKEGQANADDEFKMCYQIGAQNAIQTLKNIYLPPRYTLEYTKNYENPANNITIDQPYKEVPSAVGPNENSLKIYTCEASRNPANDSNSCNCSKLLGNTDKNSGFRNIQGPTKNAMKVCKDIFYTHMNSFENTNQELCCDYHNDVKDETECNCDPPDKKSFAIPKSTKVTLNDEKEICNCDKNSESKIDLPDCYKALHDNVPKKHILEMCENVLDKQDNLNDKDDDCSCDDKKKSTITAQQYKLQTQKNTFKLCNQNAIQKLKNIYLPPRYTLQYTKNYENPSNNGTIDQPFKKNPNAMEPNENRLKKNICEVSKKSSDLSKSCNCKPLGNPLESPDKFYSGFINTQGATQNAMNVCKNVFFTQMNTFDNTNQEQCCNYLNDVKDETSCNCDPPDKNSFVIPKSTKVTINDEKEMCNCNQNSDKEFDLPECLLALNKHVPKKNILEMCKSILDKQDNLNEKLEPSKKVQLNDCCTNKSAITAQEYKLQTQSNTFELCNQLGAQNAIQTLKNIYLPPRYTLEYTKHFENPDNNVATEQPVKEVLSTKVSRSCSEVTGTAMLSAEVMNLPYSHFHDSLARKHEAIPGVTSKLTKYDIFKRIKEAYNACSCKVCECIIGKTTTKNEICKCKPCECKDCMSYLDESKYKSPTSKFGGSNPFYVSCDKGHYKGVEQQQTCDCKPCDCVKCTSITQPCDCEPCQCIVCQSQKKVRNLRTLVVAPVGEQRVTCTCSPCDCIECGQGFPATSRTTNDMSTTTNRHALCRCEICLNDHCEHGGVDFCGCERQKRVMNKPFEKGTHDYDIRTASIARNTQVNNDKTKLSARHDTIAMFAALPYTLPTYTAKNYPSATKICSCEECECFSCACKENAINAIKSSQLFPLKKSSILSDYNVHDQGKVKSPQNCNCTTCECEICDTYFVDQCHDNNVSVELAKNCSCNICNRINCPGEPRVIKYSFNELCQNRCENCFGDKCLSNQIVHPIKRGELLTPSTHKFKVQSLGSEKQRLELPIASNKCDNYMQYQDRNQGKSLPENNSIDNKISGSVFSGYSSFETSPKTSCHKYYGGLTPISQNKNKSWESSCNSSGHDYPEYLIKFPKSTVETCLKDVMKLNMDKTIALDKFNIVPPQRTVKYKADSMSNELMSEKDNLSQSYGYNLISSCDCTTGTAKCPEFIDQCDNISNGCVDHHRYAYAPWESDLVESTCNCKFEVKNNSRLGGFGSLQTSEFSPHNCSGCIEENTSSITVAGSETKTETRKCFHILQKIDDVHVACKMQCNTSEQKLENNLIQIKNEEFRTWEFSKPLSQGNFGGDYDTFNRDEEYTRVQKTLKEAKEYSAVLMQMLEMYKKANNEFESISDKLKIPQDSVSKDDVDIEHELQEISLEVLSVKEVLTSTSILKESIKPERTFAECENDFNTISRKMGRTELTTMSNHTTCNQLKGECELTKKLSTANKIIPLKQNDKNYLETSELRSANENFSLKQNEMCPYEAVIEYSGNNSKDSVHAKNSKDTKPRHKGSMYDRDSALDCQRIRKKDRINGKNYKKYSKLLKRTIIISKRVTLKNSHQNTPNPPVKYCVTEGTSAAEMNSNSSHEKNYSIPANSSEKESSDSCGNNSQRKFRENLIMGKLDSVSGREQVSVSTSTDPYLLKRDFRSMNESESSSMAQALEELKPWPILKKKYPNNKPNTKNKRVGIFAPLELPNKQAVQSLSLQTSATIAPKKRNKALVKLQHEVKNLLDMPILQLQTPSTCRDTKKSLNIEPKNKMGLELKETATVSFQTNWKGVKCVDKEVWCSYTREAVESLINDLLHLSVMTPLEKGKEVNRQKTVNIDKKPPSIINRKCSCDALKVGFLGVRRVSDHTVLVKWNVPRKLAKVHGYELLVDGRAVHKTFSATKSMAVVTCLPHTDKVLLTIRTITSSVSVTGHYPAATIIYRPRAKHY